MSSILRALKKVEEDKSTLRPDELKIDAEILRTDSSPRSSSTVALLSSLLLLAGGSGATYLYMTRDSAVTTVSTQAVTTAKESRNPVVTAPPVQIETERVPPAIVVVPATQHEKVKKEVSTRPEKPGRVTNSATPPPKKAVKTAPAPPAAAPPAAAHSPSAAAKVRSIPALRVNGIAFQNNSTDSMAIINGKPVATGGIIEGVTVEKILNDTVLFQLNGENFEIKLGQSNR